MHLTSSPPPKYGVCISVVIALLTAQRHLIWGVTPCRHSYVQWQGILNIPCLLRMA